MLQRLDVQNPRILTDGVAFDPNGSAATDSLQIRDISGLDPVAANVSSALYSVVDGETITGITVGKRNIVITVGFNSNPFGGYSVTELRQIVYRYFMPKSTVLLTVHRYGEPPVQIEGVVEKIEDNHFAKDPEVQISVICADPYFKSLSKTTVSGLVLDSARDDIGNYSEIVYAGDVASGVELTVTSPSLTSTDSWHFKTLAPTIQDFWLYAQTLSPSVGFVVSTLTRNRYIQRTNGTSLLGYVPYGSDWTLLYPGTNLFAIAAENNTFAENVAPTWTLSYYALYGGV